jgi:hypothetical protein
MPPIARSTVHSGAFALVSQWINDVVDSSYDNADACNGSSDEPHDSPTLPLCAPDQVPGIGGECLPL